jgi:hypothetical protein
MVFGFHKDDSGVMFFYAALNSVAGAHMPAFFYESNEGGSF